MMSKHRKEQTPEIAGQIKRIIGYEAMMEEASRLMTAEKRSPEEEETLRQLLSDLGAYYGSAEWKQDFAADEASLLPSDLKRGVLSEDGLYNLLAEGSDLSRCDSQE